MIRRSLVWLGAYNAAMIELKNAGHNKRYRHFHARTRADMAKAATRA
jgi:hypothetical protein